MLQIGVKRIFQLLIYSLLITVQSPLNPINKTIPGTDSSIYIYIGKMINNGSVPYLDWFDHKGPIIYFINYYLMLLSEEYGIWIFENFCIIITLIFSYIIIKRNKNNLVADTSIIFLALFIAKYYDGGNSIELYCLPLITINLYRVTNYLKLGQINTKDLIIDSLIISTVLLLKINYLFFIITYSPLLYLGEIKNKSSIIIKLISFVILFISPIMVYLIYNKAFNEFIDQYLIFNFKYLKNKLSSQIILSSITNILSITLTISFFGLTKIRGNYSKANYYVILLLFISALITIHLTLNTYKHYFLVIMPALIYPISNAFEFIIEKKIKWLIPIITIFTILEIWMLFYIKTNLNKEISEIKYINSLILNNSEKNSTISILGNEAFFYTLSGRNSNSKYFYQTPIIDSDINIENKYLKDLVNNPPSLVVLNKNRFKNYDRKKILNKISSILFKKYYLIYESKKIKLFKKM